MGDDAIDRLMDMGGDVHRLAEMRDRAEPAGRAAMRRQVDRDDAETILDQRRDEAGHLAGMAAPAMHQQHDWSLAPAIGDDPPRRAAEIVPVGAGQYRLLAFGEGKTLRMEKDPPRQFAAQIGRD